MEDSYFLFKTIGNFLDSRTSDGLAFYIAASIKNHKSQPNLQNRFTFELHVSWSLQCQGLNPDDKPNKAIYNSVVDVFTKVKIECIFK